LELQKAYSYAITLTDCSEDNGPNHGFIDFFRRQIRSFVETRNLLRHTKQQNKLREQHAQPHFEEERPRDTKNDPSREGPF